MKVFIGGEELKPMSDEEREAFRLRFKKENPQIFEEFENIKQKLIESKERQNKFIQDMVEQDLVEIKKEIKKKYAFLFDVQDHCGVNLRHGTYYQYRRYNEGPYPFFWLGWTETFRWKEYPSDEQLTTELRLRERWTPKVRVY